MPASGYPAGNGGGANYPSERDYDPTPRRPLYRKHRQNPSYNPPIYHHNRALSEENFTSLSQLHTIRQDQDLTTDLLTGNNVEDSSDAFYSMRSPQNSGLPGNWGQFQPNFESNEEPLHTRHQSLLFSQRHAGHGSVSKLPARSKHEHQSIGVNRMNRPQRTYATYEREPPMPKFPVSSLDITRDSRVPGIAQSLNGQQTKVSAVENTHHQHSQIRPLGSPGPIMWNRATDEESLKVPSMYHQTTPIGGNFPSLPNTVADPYPNRFEVGLGIGMSPPRSFQALNSANRSDQGTHCKPLGSQDSSHQTASSSGGHEPTQQTQIDKLAVDPSSTTSEFGLPPSNCNNMWTQNTFENENLNQDAISQGNGIASSSRGQVAPTFTLYDPMPPNIHTNYENLESHVQMSGNPTTSWGFSQPAAEARPAEARPAYVPYSEVHRRQEEGRINSDYEKQEKNVLTQSLGMARDVSAIAGSSSVWYPRMDSWNGQDMSTSFRDLSPDSSKLLKAEGSSALDDLLFPPPSRFDYADALESQQLPKPPADKLAIEKAFGNEQDLSMDVPGPDYDEEAKMLEWSEDAVEEMLNLLEAAERYKWKYVSEELSQRQNKRIPSRACKNKFSSMFGETECSSLLRSSLFYVAYRSGWQTIRNIRTESERQAEQEEVKHELGDATLANSALGEKLVKADDNVRESPAPT